MDIIRQKSTNYASSIRPTMQAAPAIMAKPSHGGGGGGSPITTLVTALPGIAALILVLMRSSGTATALSSGGLSSGLNNSLFTTSNVGIGTNNPAGRLQVVGNAFVTTGNLGVGTISASSKLTVVETGAVGSYITTLRGTNNLNKGLLVDLANQTDSVDLLRLKSGNSSKFVVYGDGITEIGNDTQEGELRIYGGMEIEGLVDTDEFLLLDAHGANGSGMILTSTGKLLIGNISETTDPDNLESNYKLQVYGDINVIGDIYNNGRLGGAGTALAVVSEYLPNLTVGGTLTVENEIRSNNLLTVVRDTMIGGNLTVLNQVAINSNLTVDGRGNFTDLFVTKDIFFNGNIYQDGELFGAGTTGTVTGVTKFSDVNTTILSAVDSDWISGHPIFQEGRTIITSARGGYLEKSFIIIREGTYILNVNYLLGPDFGFATILIDDEALVMNSSPQITDVDLYSPYGSTSPNMLISYTVSLKSGSHRFKIVNQGSFTLRNPSSGGFKVGLGDSSLVYIPVAKSPTQVETRIRISNLRPENGWESINNNLLTQTNGLILTSGAQFDGFYRDLSITTEGGYLINIVLPMDPSYGKVNIELSGPAGPDSINSPLDIVELYTSTGGSGSSRIIKSYSRTLSTGTYRLRLANPGTKNPDSVGFTVGAGDINFILINAGLGSFGTVIFSAPQGDIIENDADGWIGSNVTGQDKGGFSIFHPTTGFLNYIDEEEDSKYKAFSGASTSFLNMKVMNDTSTVVNKRDVYVAFVEKDSGLLFVKRLVEVPNDTNSTYVWEPMVDRRPSPSYGGVGPYIAQNNVVTNDDPDNKNLNFSTQHVSLAVRRIGDKEFIYVAFIQQTDIYSEVTEDNMNSSATLDSKVRVKQYIPRTEFIDDHWKFVSFMPELSPSISNGPAAHLSLQIDSVGDPIIAYSNLESFDGVSTSANKLVVQRWDYLSETWSYVVNEDLMPSSSNTDTPLPPSIQNGVTPRGAFDISLGLNETQLLPNFIPILPITSSTEVDVAILKTDLIALPPRTLLNLNVTPTMKYNRSGKPFFIPGTRIRVSYRNSPNDLFFGMIVSGYSTETGLLTGDVVYTFQNTIKVTSPRKSNWTVQYDTVITSSTPTTVELGELNFSVAPDQRLPPDENVLGELLYRPGTLLKIVPLLNGPTTALFASVVSYVNDILKVNVSNFDGPGGLFSQWNIEYTGRSSVRNQLYVAFKDGNPRPSDDNVNVVNGLSVFTYDTINAFNIHRWRYLGPLASKGSVDFVNLKVFDDSAGKGGVLFIGFEDRSVNAGSVVRSVKLEDAADGWEFVGGSQSQGFTQGPVHNLVMDGRRKPIPVDGIDEYEIYVGYRDGRVNPLGNNFRSRMSIMYHSGGRNDLWNYKNPTFEALDYISQSISRLDLNTFKTTAIRTLTMEQVEVDQLVEGIKIQSGLIILSTANSERIMILRSYGSPTASLLIQILDYNALSGMISGRVMAKLGGGTHTEWNASLYRNKVEIQVFSSQLERNTSLVGDVLEVEVGPGSVSTGDIIRLQGTNVPGVTIDLLVVEVVESAVEPGGNIINARVKGYVFFVDWTTAITNPSTISEWRMFAYLAFTSVEAGQRERIYLQIFSDLIDDGTKVPLFPYVQGDIIRVKSINFFGDDSVASFSATVVSYREREPDMASPVLELVMENKNINRNQSILIFTTNWEIEVISQGSRDTRHFTTGPVAETAMAVVDFEEATLDIKAIYRLGQPIIFHGSYITIFDEYTDNPGLYPQIGEEVGGFGLEYDYFFPLTTTYRITVSYVMGEEFGVSRLRINGVIIGDPVDCFLGDRNPKTWIRNVGYTVAIFAGSNTLRLENVGTRNNSSLGFNIGVASVKIEYFSVTRDGDMDNLTVTGSTALNIATINSLSVAVFSGVETLTVGTDNNSLIRLGNAINQATSVPLPMATLTATKGGDVALTNLEFNGGVDFRVTTLENTGARTNTAMKLTNTGRLLVGLGEEVGNISAGLVVQSNIISGVLAHMENVNEEGNGLFIKTASDVFRNRFPLRVQAGLANICMLSSDGFLSLGVDNHADVRERLTVNGNARIMGGFLDLGVNGGTRSLIDMSNRKVLIDSDRERLTISLSAGLAINSQLRLFAGNATMNADVRLIPSTKTIQTNNMNILATNTAKAWIRFETRVGAGLPTSSYNIRSVTRVRAGVYSVRLIRPMSQRGYTINVNTDSRFNLIATVSNSSEFAFVVTIRTTSGAEKDGTFVHCVVYGD